MGGISTHLVVVANLLEAFGNGMIPIRRLCINWSVLHRFKVQFYRVSVSLVPRPRPHKEGKGSGDY